MSPDLGTTPQDLAFVRQAVQRERSAPFPTAIALLWAGISLVGFPLIDLAPRATPLYWAIASPLGFVLSLWLGARSARHAGAVDRGDAARWAWHWLGVLAAAVLAALPALTGDATWDAYAAGVLLLTAVAYFTAGIHLHRSLLAVAAVLAAGYLAVLYAPGPTWTYVGVAAAAALAGTALLGHRRRAAH